MRSQCPCVNSLLLTFCSLQKRPMCCYTQKNCVCAVMYESGLYFYDLTNAIERQNKSFKQQNGTYVLATSTKGTIFCCVFLCTQRDDS